MSCFSLLGTFYGTSLRNSLPYLDTWMRAAVPTAGKKLQFQRADSFFTCRNLGGHTYMRYGGRARASEKPLPATVILGGKGRAIYTHCYAQFRTVPRAGSLAPGEGEVHLYLGLNLDRFTVQQVGLILPLFHGLDRGRSQHRVSADQLQVFDVAFLADLSLQDDDALNASLTRQWRIHRLRLPDQQSGEYARRNPDTRWRCHLRRRNRYGAEHAANNAAHGSARNAARDTAHYAGRSHGRRRLVFLNHFDFLRNLGGRAQFAVDDIGLNHPYVLDHCGCWRRWRWRWRGGHQHEQRRTLGQGFGENQRDQNHHADNHELDDERDDRRAAPFRLQPATGLDKAIFKHSDSPLTSSDPYGHLDTGCFPFAPAFYGTPRGLPEPARRFFPHPA